MSRCPVDSPIVPNVAIPDGSGLHCLTTSNRVQTNQGHDVSKSTHEMGGAEMMTTKEVADLFRVCEQTIRRLHAKGELVGTRPGLSPRAALKFKREDVEAFLEKRRGL